MAKVKQGPEKHTAGTKFIVLEVTEFSDELAAFREQTVYEFKTYKDAKEFIDTNCEGVYAILELKSVFSVLYEAKITELK